MYIWGFSRLKRGPRNEKKNVKQRERLNKSKEKSDKKMTFPLVFISSTLEKGLISQRRREKKKNDISFSFYIVYLDWREKKRLRRISHRALKITLTPFS